MAEQQPIWRSILIPIIAGVSIGFTVGVFNWARDMDRGFVELKTRFDAFEKLGGGRFTKEQGDLHKKDIDSNTDRIDHIEYDIKFLESLKND